MPLAAPPHPRGFFRGACWALPALLLLSCGEEETLDARWCEQLCGLLDDCGESPASSCPSTCVDNNRSYFDRTTPRALRIEAVCFELTRSCSLEACVAAPGTVGPTAESTSFCRELSSEFFACRAFASPDECGAYFGRFRGAALESGMSCAGRGCTELQGCLEQTVFSYDARASQAASAAGSRAVGVALAPPPAAESRQFAR